MNGVDVKMFEQASWIKQPRDYGTVCPIFKKEFECGKNIKKAVLNITALGVYEAHINGDRVGNFIMAPGWTAYQCRLLYQSYDITGLLKEKNKIEVGVGRGWYLQGIQWREKSPYGDSLAALVQLDITYENGETESVVTDESWLCGESKVRFCEIYDGEVYDASAETEFQPAQIYDYSKDILIPQEGEFVTEHEHLYPISVFTTRRGETVIDFGQNLTGYVSFSLNAKRGDIIEYSHAEILDKDGNFYTDNLRSAKQHVKYICTDGEQSYKPHFTFMGFRYIRMEKMPESLDLNSVEAIAVHSDIKRTGHFECSNKKLNKLYSNVIWGQKDNFLDIPTDCPQRDERFGWTGDAQVFVKTASYNFDVKEFFKKWLRDLKADQKANGGVPNIVPDIQMNNNFSAAWGDAAVICPWQIYLTYADKGVLEEQIDSMTAWVEYIHSAGSEEYLWLDGSHFGDWLGLDAKEGEYKGSSRDDFIASAFFAYSTSLLIKALRVLGRDASKYEKLHENIVKAFRKKFPECNTQTECVLALTFDLAEDRKKIADQLAQMVHAAGDALQTGFVGTPYLLSALSENGYEELAYTLLLREEYPSWLFSVNMGATTIWEHWDGMKGDGSMWSTDMNSFNHYAYGAVASWMYETICGIRTDEEHPGFEHIILKPITDKRLDFASASIDTKYGKVSSKWHRDGDSIHFEFEVPTSATIILNGKKEEVKAGKYTYTI